MNAINECIIQNLSDAQGNPAGGTVTGIGIDIEWQNGPLGRDAERKAPNGAFVETVISAAQQRLQYYQESKFACQENADAMYHLEMALSCLASRTKKREEREVEGTHTL